MQWVAVSRGLIAMIPENRPKSKIEAAAIITADQQDGVDRSHREYGRIFQWDHKTVKTFLASGAIVNLSNSPDKNSDINMFGSDIPQTLTLDNNSPNAPHLFPNHSPYKNNDNEELQDMSPQAFPIDSPITPQLFNIEILERDKPCPSSPSKDLFDLWNNTAEGTSLSKATKFNSTRQKKCSARLKERPLDEWAEIFRRIVSIFDARVDGEWMPDFDWIIKNDENATKVQEGKFNWISSPSRPSDSRYNEIFAGA